MGFVIKLKQLVTEPAQTIKYLGIVIDWIRITLAERKMENFIRMLNNIFKEEDNSFAADTISMSSIIHRTSSSSSSNLVLLPSASVSVSVEKSSLKKRKLF